MNIISPEFSFLDFSYIDSDNCGNDTYFILPVCNDLSIKAQIEIELSPYEELSTEENPLYIALCDSDCNIIYDDDIEVDPICSLYKFVQLFEDEPVPPTQPDNLCYTGDEEPTVVQDFVINPFDEITSADLEFDLELSPLGNQLQLYIGGNVYIFEWSADAPDVIGYDYIQIGNVYFVRILNDGGDTQKRTNLLDALQVIVDVNEGTTTSLSSPTFTIADIPTGSYLNNYLFIENISTVTTSTNIGQYFYYNNGSMHYFINVGNTPTDLLYSFETNLVGTLSYRFKFHYNSFYNDMTGNVVIFDGTTTTTIPIEFNEYNGIIDVSYTALVSIAHTITLEVDNQSHKNGLSISKIEQYDTVFFNVTTNVSGNVPVANYSKAELIALISEILGFDFDCEFESCCEVPDIAFQVRLQGDDAAFYDFQLTKYWRKGFIDFPALDLDVITESCFTYAILDADKNLIACSNLFQKTDDCCYVSKIEYSNNEDAFGFTYPTGVTNSINFPFFLHSPKYPTTEKIYKQTNGIYKRLSADIEKEYDCETDYIEEYIHDKLITALKHDTVIITSNRLEFTSQMSQQGDYSPDWNSKIDFTSKAEFKLRKYFNGKNNNCGSNC